MDSNIFSAIQTFELDQHYEKIFDDPNELIEAGFSANWLLLLITTFQSTDGYRYFRRGTFVNEMIDMSGSKN